MLQILLFQRSRTFASDQPVCLAPTSRLPVQCCQLRRLLLFRSRIRPGQMIQTVMSWIIHPR